ncbi:hypothetical protein PGIGA_G00129550 [Pangasianodon gigas]|uniref:Uncharacterized protein n=1 Tax=Pangasianodon gigas TaxID=30993 RepID=A0ACC5XI66_PANGG|nr:hypothetical protein [Pangasianodon gigas]
MHDAPSVLLSNVYKGVSRGQDLQRSSSFPVKSVCLPYKKSRINTVPVIPMVPGLYSVCSGETEGVRVTLSSALTPDSQCTVTALYPSAT